MASRTKRWSQQVTEHSDALTLEPEVFKSADARAIARSLKRSADRSRRRKSSPYRSAMSMLTFYLNRAGRQLPAARRKVLQQAKDELRDLYGTAPARQSRRDSKRQETKAGKRTTRAKRKTAKRKARESGARRKR